MKTNTSLAIAMVVLSIFASNAFAVLRSPYPSKPSPPDHIITIIIGQDRHDLVRTTHRGIEMNILVTYQVMAFMAVIEQAGIPALRVAFTIAVIVFLVWRLCDFPQATPVLRSRSKRRERFRR